MKSNRRLSIAAVVILGTPLARGVSPSPGEMAEARRWTAAKFEGAQRQEPDGPGLRVNENHGPVQANRRGEEPLRIGAKE